MNIRYIALDLDGTIMHDGYFNKMLDEVFLDASKNTGRNISEIRDRFNRINRMTERSYKYYDWNMKFKIIGGKLTFEDLIVRYASMIKVYEDALIFIRNVFGKYVLICATNGYRSIQEIKLKLTGLYVYFSKIISADVCKSYKPQPQFYKCLINKLNVSPSKILFIDDIYEMALGAAKEGMKAVWINRNKDERRDDRLIIITNFNELLSQLNFR